MNRTTFDGSLVKSNRIIYTPSDFAKANLIHLQETGMLKTKQPHISKRKDLSSYLFFIVQSGSGTLEYNKITYPLQQGDCVFVDCNKPYFHQSSDHLWSLQWSHFYGANLAAIYHKYVERGGNPCFHPENINSYSTILHQIYTLAASQDYIRDMKINEQLTMLLTLIMDQSWNDEKKVYKIGNKRNLQEIKTYLDEHYQEKLILEELADIFFINKFYLTRIFKEQFGISINNYLLQIRITRAKELLRFTDLSVEKIGADCGILDANYFARTFKKAEGVSPGEFRKLW